MNRAQASKKGIGGCRGVVYAFLFSLPVLLVIGWLLWRLFIK